MPDKNQADLPAAVKAGKSPAFRNAMKMAGNFLLAAAVLFVIMIFASDIDRMAAGSIDLTYSLGCSLVNYSAGFVRRGLLGEIIQHMDALFQPFLSIALLASVPLF